MSNVGIVLVIVTMGLPVAGCSTDALKRVSYSALQSSSASGRLDHGSGTGLPYDAYQAEREHALDPSPTPTFSWKREGN
jgi:hypothetical protein